MKSEVSGSLPSTTSGSGGGGGTAKNRCARCGRCLWFPIRVFGLTFYRRWPQMLPNFIVWFILIFVLAFGLRLKVGQNVLDLNDNLSQRGVVWYLLNIVTAVMVAFYVCEYVRESDKMRRDEENESHSTVDASGRVFVLNEGDVTYPFDSRYVPGGGGSTVSVEEHETI